jgi:hypothetical protein
MKGAEQVKIMRKVLIVPATLVLATFAAAENRLFVSAGASFLRPADEAYRTVYGNQAVFPEFSVSIRVVRGLCLSGSLGQFSRKGTTPELGLETRANQSYISYGLSYLLRLSSTLCLQAGGGLASLRFREEAFDEEVKGHRSGYKIEGGILLVPEDERVFMGLTVGYISARVPAEAFTPALAQPLRLGGIKIAVSIGVQIFGGE